MKKVIKKISTIICLIIIMFVFSYSIVYADMMLNVEYSYDVLPSFFIAIILVVCVVITVSVVILIIIIKKNKLEKNSD